VLQRYKQAHNVIDEIIVYTSDSLAGLGDHVPEFDLGSRLPFDFIKDKQIDIPERVRNANILKLTFFNTEAVPYEGVTEAEL
jgi:hypothetical protein